MEQKKFLWFKTGRVYDFPQRIVALQTGVDVSVWDASRRVSFTIRGGQLTRERIMRAYDSAWPNNDPDRDNCIGPELIALLRGMDGLLDAAVCHDCGRACAVAGETCRTCEQVVCARCVIDGECQSCGARYCDECDDPVPTKTYKENGGLCEQCRDRERERSCL